MGHLINPVSFRLGVTSYWRSSYLHYFLKHKEYNYFFFLDKLLVDFVSWLMKINWYVNSLFVPFFHFKDSGIFLKTHVINYKKDLFLFDFFFKSFAILSRRINFTFFDCWGISSGLISFEDQINDISYLLDSFYLSFFNLVGGEFKNVDLRKEIWARRKYIFPEISHFNIYYSGFYNIKIYLYFQNREFFSSVLKESFNDTSFIKSDIKSYFSEVYKDLFDSYILKIYYPLFLYILFFRFFNWFFFFFSLFRLVSYEDFLKFRNFNRLNFVFILILIENLFTLRFISIFENVSFFDSIPFYLHLFLKKVFYKRSLLNYKYNSLLKYKKFFLDKFLLFLTQNFYDWYFYLVFKKLLKFFFSNLKIDIFFKLMENNNISARLIFNFFVRNLRTRKPIGRLVNFIISDVILVPGLLGFKVLTSGRFTRKERAFYKWISVKRAPLSTYNSMLDYYVGVYKSRFGICGIKIWLFKKIN